MKEQFIEQCLLVLARDDVKKEVKEFFKPLISLITMLRINAKLPLISLIVQEIYPYIYLSLIFVIISFLLILGIFYLLLRTNLKSMALK